MDVRDFVLGFWLIGRCRGFARPDLHRSIARARKHGLACRIRLRRFASDISVDLRRDCDVVVHHLLVAVLGSRAALTTEPAGSRRHGFYHQAAVWPRVKPISVKIPLPHWLQIAAVLCVRDAIGIPVGSARPRTKIFLRASLAWLELFPTCAGIAESVCCPPLLVAAVSAAPAKWGEGGPSKAQKQLSCRTRRKLLIKLEKNKIGGESDSSLSPRAWQAARLKALPSPSLPVVSGRTALAGSEDLRPSRRCAGRLLRHSRT